MSLKKRGLAGTENPAITEREKENHLLSGKRARQGFVLLKNDGMLPLNRNDKLAIYGGGAGKTIKGGTGSGDVNERKSVSIYEGFVAKGVEITDKDWILGYEEIYRQARLDWKNKIHEDLPMYNGNFFLSYSSHQFSMPVGKPIDIEKAKADGADRALFVLSRIAGESKDRKDEAGDYYISHSEKQLLARVCRRYKEVCLVINSGSVVDLAFTDEFPNIKAIIYYVQAGQRGGDALASVLLGEVVPQGKLTDTWPANYRDLPSANTFSYKSGSVYKEEYIDDIYVGYRYFDTFGVPVRYGFGYGLGYTEMGILNPGLEVSQIGGENKIIACATVKNIGGKYDGREVVQVYVSAPQEGLDKEFRRLVGFKKTGLLKPGEEEKVKIEFSMEGLTSFDEEKSAYTLQKGLYGVWVGNSLESARLVGSILLDETIITEKLRHVCPLKEELKTIKPDKAVVLAKEARWHKRGEKLPVIKINGNLIKTKTAVYDSDTKPLIGKAGKLVEEMSIEKLISMASGDPSRGQSALGGAAQTVPGAAAETVGDENIASMVLADGPRGLRLKQVFYVKDDDTLEESSIFAALEHGFFEEEKTHTGKPRYQFCTSIPVGTLLAQTWDTELIKEVGEMIGHEMNLFNVTLWLAPGMNIHRNPLCGRNFEYYSEDPFLSGMIAAAMTKGVQSVAGCGTTIKHYACNNCEDNRMGSDSIVSERALREIYLKGFEIAIKESQPMSIMTSYNMVNGVHTANSYDLCTKVARDEWGFAGAIMTDWTTTVASTRGECSARGCMRAGNDMVMPGVPEDVESIKAALADGSMPVEKLKRCIYNTVKLALASNQYTDRKCYTGKD